MDSILPPLLKPSQKYKSLLIFGPPGSGKGTMGKYLCDLSSSYHLSTGDIFRGLSPSSPAGKLFHEYGSKGKLLPDELTVGIWSLYVQGLISTNKFYPENQQLMLDGIPRTVKQAEILEEYVDVQGIIYLDIQNEEELFKRLLNRGKLGGRVDDGDKEVLVHRMKVYKEETAKVLQHYPKELIKIFNAEQKPLEVLRDILVGISDLLS